MEQWMEAKVEAIQFLIDLRTKYRVAPHGRSLVGAGGGGTSSLFYTNRIGMSPGGHWRLAQLRKYIDTGELKIEKYVVAHDAGTIINPMIVDGQICGGVAQGLGGALLEELMYDENGQMLNASFMDYLLPSTTEMPNIELVHPEPIPSPLNPLGVKGLGEGGAIAPPAVLANAVSDALRPLNLEFNELPLRPDRIIEALLQQGVIKEGVSL